MTRVVSRIISRMHVPRRDNLGAIASTRCSLMKFVGAIVLQRARRTERRKAKETSKRTEDRKETTRKNVKRGRTRKAAENARDGRMRKWKRKEKARRETGNELMKDPVALMRVNLLPHLYTRDDIHTLTHTLCKSR